ncbi:MAG: cupin domain-containing protein [Gammaproteobacteria bacterium]|nr:MAG: cupin domain-containing protein [Gammaproteobacteria bacterium]
MTHPILNIADLEFHPWGHGERFEAKLGDIGKKLGARKLGYNLTVLPPGKRAFPFHSHRVNEEMFFVVEGEGEVRIGEDRHPIRSGDVICCPPGGRETAHQIINSSDAELKYLAISTQEQPEVAEYPDSGKYSIFSVLTGADGKPETMRLIIPDGGAGMNDYWEGEE